MRWQFGHRISIVLLVLTLMNFPHPFLDCFELQYFNAVSLGNQERPWIKDTLLFKVQVIRHEIFIVFSIRSKRKRLFGNYALIILLRRNFMCNKSKNLRAICAICTCNCTTYNQTNNLSNRCINLIEYNMYVITVWPWAI